MKPGRDQKCENCRFWSEMVAQAGGDIVGTEALCLATNGPKEGRYTNGKDWCKGWKLNNYGAVDEPPNYGEYTRVAYIKDEGESALIAAGCGE